MSSGPGKAASGWFSGGDVPWAGLTRVVLLVTAVLVYVRLFLGVDVTDESFYNSLPYSFGLGFRPYRDELNITQNAGILLTPLFKLHHALVGSSFGLVLFNRHLYFLLLAGCSQLAFRWGTVRVGRNFGRLLAAFVLTFSYCNIPSLSYNTLGALFLFGGLLQLLLGSTPGGQARRPRLIFGANCCFILSAFAYPTLLFSSLAGFGASLWLAVQPTPAPAPGRSRPDLLAWGASLALGVAGALVFLASVGLDGIRDSLAYASSYAYDLRASAPRTARLVLGQLQHLRLYFAGFALLLALPILPAGSFRHYGKAFFCAVLAAAAFILYLIHRQPSLAAYPAGSAPLFLCLGLLLPLVLWLLPDRRLARELGVVVLLPSLVAAAAIALSSTGGLPAAILGLFPAAACALLGVALVAGAIDRNAASNGVRVASVLGLMVPLLAFQIQCLLERSYRDTPFVPGATFASGPFAGLLTTDPNARRLAALAADLNSLGADTRTLFIYDRFPAGYLLSPLKPRTFSTWVFWPDDPAVGARLLGRVFAAAEAPPDAILQIGPRPAWVDAEVRRRKYRVHLERPEFDYVLLLRERN